MPLQRPEERLTVVSELYRYRMTPQAIATVVGCSRGTIVSDVAVLKRRGDLPLQLAGGPAFQRALQRFAELSVDSGTRASWAASRIHRALRSLLNMDAIVDQLTGAAAAFERMRDPVVDNRERGAAELIERVFWTTRARDLPRRSSDQRSDANTVAQEHVASYLTAVAHRQREIPSTIGSPQNLTALLMDEFLQRYRSLVRLPWPPGALQLLDRAIDTLPDERNREAIRLRFGLQDGRVRTLKEVGILLGGKSPERMRQRVAKALRQLRHPSRVGPLRLLAGTFSELADRMIHETLQRPANAS